MPEDELDFNRIIPPNRWNNIRLVVIDVDGTLLNTAGQISRGSAEWIRRMDSMGIMVTLISGRSLDMIEPILSELDISAPVVCLGGAAVYSCMLEEYIYERRLSADLVRLILESADGHGDRITLNTTDENIDLRSGEIDGAGISQDRVCKICIEGDSGSLGQIAGKISMKTDSLNLAYPQPFRLDVTSASVNKGSALEFLGKKLKIRKDEIMTIGNGQNDISMFRKAGISAALNNSPAGVKAEADILAPSNDSGGVGALLRRLALEKKRESCGR